MNYFLNTPLLSPSNLPLPIMSPYISVGNPFNSPLFSPYNGLQENQNSSFCNMQNDEFSNFQLQAQEEEVEKLQAAEQKAVVEEKVLEVRKPRKSVQDSEDESLVCEDNCQIFQKIRGIVDYLVRHMDQKSEKLQYEKMKFVADDKALGQVFEILLRKFKKLKKTKEEMTKYCMRKAFKFLADKYKKGLEGKETTDFLKEYFEQLETEGFCIPFKKNSDDKTMNANFLRKVFASPTFASDYKQFLKSFTRLVEEDNAKKVKNLAFTIKTFYNQGTIRKLENVKRIPWTQIILDKTIDLAENLMNHSLEVEPSDELGYKLKAALKQKSSTIVRSPSMRKKSAMSLAETIGSPANVFNAPHDQ